MPFPVLAVVAASVIAQFAAAALRARVRRPPAPDLEGWFADEGRPVPYVGGIFALSPNVVWWGDVEKGSSGPPTFYSAKLLGTLCQGPIDEVYDIQVGGKSLRLEPVTRDQSSSHEATTITTPEFPAGGLGFIDDDPIALQVHARQLFGGKNLEGGVEGEIRIYRGSLDQPVDALTTHSIRNQPVTNASARPGVCFLAIGTLDTAFYLGTLPTPKPFTLVGGRYPRALLDLGLNPAYTSPRIGFNANPMELLLEVATDTRLGCGIDPAEIDLRSLADAAAECQNPGYASAGTDRPRGGTPPIGASITLTQKEDAKAAIDELMKLVDGVFDRDPVTGLYGVVLARPDYDVDDLPVFTPANARELQVTPPGWRDTKNEVQVSYRRFAGGLVGDAPPEEVTPKLVFGPGLSQPFFIPPPPALFQLQGKNIANLVVTAQLPGQDPVELTVLTDYDYYPSTGVLWLYQTDATGGAPRIVATYKSNPETMRFVDAQENDQDLASQHATGEVRPLEIEAPFITEEVGAKAYAARVRRTASRALPGYRFLADRDAYRLRRGSVCRVANWPQLELPRVLRVVDVEHSPLEDGAIAVTAVEDLWGEDLVVGIPADVGTGSGTVGDRTAPPMAAIACIGADTLSLQASDPTFSIEIQRADDVEGTNAETAATLPGSTTSWTDAIAGKVHRARQVRPGWTPGPWAPLADGWLAVCTVEDTDPGACVLPTVDDLVDLELGTLTVIRHDPQHRITVVETKSRAGSSAETDWVAGDGPVTVALVSGEDSTITRRVTYYDCSGELRTMERTLLFPAMIDGEPVPPDGGEPGGGSAGPGVVTSLAPIVLNATGPGVWSPPPGDAGETPITRRGERWHPLDGATRCRASGFVERAGAPGEVVYAKWSLDGIRWDYLDGASGPVFPVDVVGPIRAPWLPVHPLAQTDVRIRWFRRGSDGVSRPFLGHLEYQIAASPDDSAPCADVPVESFGDYASLGELAARYTLTDTFANPATWSLDGTRLQVVVPADSGSGWSYWATTLTGYAPNETVPLSLAVSADRLAGIAEVGLEVPGQAKDVVDVAGRIVTLRVIAVADPAGEIPIRIGVLAGDSAPPDGGSVAVVESLDYADRDAMLAVGWEEVSTGGVIATVSADTGIVEPGETQSLHFALTKPAFYNGNHLFRKPLTGLVPSGLYRLTARGRSKDRPTFMPAICRFVGAGSGGYSQSLSANEAWQDLIHHDSATAEGAGALEVGIRGDTIAALAYDLWYGPLTLTYLGSALPDAAPRTIWFEDLTRVCLGDPITSDPGGGLGGGGLGGGAPIVPAECGAGTGPTVTLTGLYTAPYDKRDFAPGTFVDASGADFRGNDASVGTASEEQVQMRGRNLTVCGLVIASALPLNTPWTIMHGRDGFYSRLSPGLTLRNFRIRDTGDAVSLGPGCDNVALVGGYVLRMRDDPFEFDWWPNALVDDCLVEFCYSGISLRPDKDKYGEISARGKMCTIRNTLIRPGVFPIQLTSPQLRFGGPFKIAPEIVNGVRIERLPVAMHNVVIRLDSYDDNSQFDLFLRGTLKECTDSLLVYTLGSKYPRRLPPGMDMTTDPGAWDEARERWVTAPGRPSTDF